jgi:hypothetical protein
MIVSSLSLHESVADNHVFPWITLRSSLGRLTTACRPGRRPKSRIPVRSSPAVKRTDSSRSVAGLPPGTPLTAFSDTRVMPPRQNSPFKTSGSWATPLPSELRPIQCRNGMLRSPPTPSPLGGLGDNWSKNPREDQAAHWDKAAAPELAQARRDPLALRLRPPGGSGRPGSAQAVCPDRQHRRIALGRRGRRGERLPGCCR